MDKLRMQIIEWVCQYAEDMIADIQSFARIRSVSRADLAQENAPFGPECREMLSFALDRAKELGFATMDHEGYCGSAYIGDPENAIAIIGHLDVVPEGDKWIYPPYAATRRGEYLIGRGVSDNKASVVLSLYMMKMFKDLKIDLKHGLRAIMGCSEETGMRDMRYFKKHYGEPVLALIPDASFPANYAQKGSMKGSMNISLGSQIASFTGGEVLNMVPPYAEAILTGIKIGDTLGKFGDDITCVETENGVTVKAQGIAAHAARPEGGKSAIYVLANELANSGLLSGDSLKAMKSVALMTADTTGAHCGIACEDPDTGATTMVCGLAKMVGNGVMSLSLDCRTSLAADHDKDIAALTAYAESLGFEIARISCTEPVYMPKDDPRMQTVIDVYADVTGDRLEPYTMGGGTYSREFKNSITFGPGFPDFKEKPADLPEQHGGAHGPDEFLHIPSFLRAFEIYACAIMKLDDII